MKFAILPIVLAAAVLAQDNSAPDQGDESTYVSETEGSNAGATPVPAVAGSAAPQMAVPTAMPMPAVVPGPSTESLLERLASYFDLSHVTSSIASAPVFMAKVYDPASGKFTMVSSSVMRAGGAYYVPVCPTDAIADAGLTPIVDAASACSYGIQLTPMPSNAASALYRVVRTAFKAIMSAGGSQTTMPMGQMGQSSPMGQMGQSSPMGQMGQSSPMGQMNQVGQMGQMVQAAMPSNNM
ncbi:hypothetical protein H4R18_000357 [Coemansia javaensis]|uniref:Uncharacterized protein n=1 Tax=Coemansia javaensis TaxID=2761396 RepID=A0A9W8LKN4_9FUNG|nr:hypothetical protein H4R18_000357 [Coemansia javaensis]